MIGKASLEQLFYLKDQEVAALYDNQHSKD